MQAQWLRSIQFCNFDLILGQVMSFIYVFLLIYGDLKNISEIGTKTCPNLISPHTNKNLYIQKLWHKLDCEFYPPWFFKFRANNSNFKVCMDILIMDNFSHEREENFIIDKMKCQFFE